MCSILAILGSTLPPATLREQAVRLSRLQRHRGPDASGVFTAGDSILVHERLEIVDPEHGGQPLVNAAGTHAVIVNGEIYNHRELRTHLATPYPFRTRSDCEIILALYREHGSGFIDMLNGIFAFVLVDRETGRYLVARDHLGIVPLYLGAGSDGALHVASEMKALLPACSSIREFPPGHVLDSRVGRLQPWYRPAWTDYRTTVGRSVTPAALREALSEAVRRQLMSDAPYAVLLSGGVDSSAIAACVRMAQDGGAERAPGSFRTYSVGLADSPDLRAARVVAEQVGSLHHEVTFTTQDGIDVLPEVIEHLETYDVTTIRAAVPMYILARRLRADGIKMVLSGEGADEIFGGYLYFHRAPDPEALHAETVRKLERIHRFDCLRANKAMAAWGVEARVPFLDRVFLDFAMSMDPARKMPAPWGIEKHLLRTAFSRHLPDSVTWRQKEQFSDGVGYGWIDGLRAFANLRVSDGELEAAASRFPLNPPTTKEAYLYRTLFARGFGLPGCAECVPGGGSVACSTPEALAWDASWAGSADPSGRAAAGIHAHAY